MLKNEMFIGTNTIQYNPMFIYIAHLKQPKLTKVLHRVCKTEQSTGLQTIRQSKEQTL